MTEELPPGWSRATLQECCTSVEKVNPRHVNHPGTFL